MPHDTEAAIGRRAAFIAAIPPSLAQAEDALPREIASLNASARSKLHRIYRLADEISKVREPFVACEKGCASCCHMNVSITSAEADRLAKAAGRRAAPISRSQRHADDKFASQPCPFLGGDGACSVYVDRPLACRKHASFFAHAGPCHPTVMNDLEVPNVGFSGLDGALFTASTEHGQLVIADIRDFFPAASA